MDHHRYQQRSAKEPPLRPHAPKLSERQSLLSFYQRYSYRDGPRDNIVNGNLPPPPPSDTSNLEKTTSYLTADVSTRWTDLILLVNFFISGLVDSGAYNAYSCFVSMQTGNTIFLALGVNSLPVDTPSLAWLKSLTAILSFLLGAALISYFHRTFGERRRWVLAASFSFQMLVTAFAAVLVHSGSSSESPVRPGEPSAPALTSASTSASGLNFGGIPRDIGFPTMDLLAIGLLSFQAAGKVVASRVLGFNALPSVVLTTLYNDLASDPALFTAGLMGNVQRNRRFGGLMFYIFGALLGGVFARSSVGFAGALWFTAGLKVLIVGAWLVWREEEEEKEYDEEG